MTGVDVSLSPLQQQLAIFVAGQQYLLNMKRGGPNLEWGRLIEPTMASMAAAQYLEFDWPNMSNVQKLGPILVRHNPSPDGPLVAFKREQHDAYMLVHGGFGSYKLMGWASHEDMTTKGAAGKAGGEDCWHIAPDKVLPLDVGLPELLVAHAAKSVV